MIDLSLEQAWTSPTLAVVDSTAVWRSRSQRFTLLAWKDWPSTQHILYSIVNRVESEDERQDRLARRRKHYWSTSHHYWTCWFLNSETWPTTIPCMVTGEDDVTASDTSKLSAILHYRITVHLAVQWQCSYTCKLQC